MQKLLNQINGFCYLRTSLDLKIPDIVKASNQRDYQEYGTNFCKKSISGMEVILSIHKFLLCKYLVKNGCPLSGI